MPPVTRWKDFRFYGAKYHWKYRAERDCHDPAVILYSGGTTGVTKGILLSNYNFNALAKQIIATNPMFRPGDKMLAVMPMFHGFRTWRQHSFNACQRRRCILVPFVLQQKAMQNF